MAASLIALLLPVSLIVTMGPSKPKSRATASGGGGFGASKGGGGFGAPKKLPPTFEEVISGWKTRLPSDSSVACACGVSSESYLECCQPYHKGKKAAESPEACLKSRYCAFAYRLPEYIIRTTHKTNSDYTKDKIKWARKLNKEQMFDSFRFNGLEIGELEAGESEDEQFLNLRVTLMPVDDAGIPKQVDPMVFTERSKFLRNAKGTWLYAAGEVRTEAAGFKDRVLNNDADLESMRTDVDYVQQLIKDKGPGS